MENATNSPNWKPASAFPASIFNMTMHQIATYTLLFLLAYPTLVSALRFRRLRHLHERYRKYATRESMAQMTDDDAFQIQKEMIQLEFPFFYLKALQFALFRTYGIPTISRTLTNTAQFSNPETALKRYSDTSALIQEFTGQPPSSSRARSALARTRFLHSGYRASGKILESDMLYTLGVFPIQPIRFIARFEWRELSVLEKCAIGTFWKSVGDGLGISYDVLPSGKIGFRDGLHWLEEMEVWCDEYEARCMRPDVKNRETADQTTKVLVYMLPKNLAHVGLYFVSFIMDQRLRAAMLYDAPPTIYAHLFSAILSLRRFAMRYLALPRPYFLRYTTYTDKPDEHGRIFQTEWDAAPYYVKPTFRHRWGPIAWLTWVLGLPLPGDQGEKYYPQGYHIPDVGPRYFEGKGRNALETTMEELKVSRTGGCPFH